MHKARDPLPGEEGIKALRGASHLALMLKTLILAERLKHYVPGVIRMRPLHQQELTLAVRVGLYRKLGKLFAEHPQSVLAPPEIPPALWLYTFGIRRRPLHEPLKVHEVRLGVVEEARQLATFQHPCYEGVHVFGIAWLTGQLSRH